MNEQRDDVSAGGALRDAARMMLEAIGEDVEREGLRDTPGRYARAMKFLTKGYTENPADIITTFTETAYDEMVILRSVEFYSLCEHHLLPFFGTATIAYIPKGKVIGVSKLARILDIFARRLQIQERLTVQVTSTIDQAIAPYGSACIIKARHLCMSARGVEKQSSEMVTSSLTGMFRTNPVARAEFLSLAGVGR